MLSIRLRRMGGKGSPSYRVVVSDRRKTPKGRFVENVGTYDPNMDPPKISLNLEKIEHWMSKGANPSQTVRSLLARSRRSS